MKTAVLVLDATGVIGRGVVEAVLEAGRPVVAVAPEQQELEQLQACHPGADIVAVPGSITGDQDCAQLAIALRHLGRPIAGVIVAVSGQGRRGRLLDQPIDAMRCQLDADLLPHLAAARHLLPLLAEARRGGSYVLIGGPGSALPWAGYGHRSVAAAALCMLARVLHDEARNLAVRVQLLSVERPIPEATRAQHLCPQWPTALEIGRRALALVEGDGGQPPRAVVPYAKPGDRTGDVDSDAPASTLGSPLQSGPDDLRFQVSISQSLPEQEPDSEPQRLAARCLQDARALLESIASPNPNQPNQETSPR
jgi:NAD(P)-dependent dehydrogenase (short-subunit alcohol dehydrogenase family)